MQAIYSLHTNPYISENQAEKMLISSIDSYIELYHFAIYTLLEVVNYTHTDAELKATKHLKAKGDETVEVKLLNNQAIIELNENNAFQKFSKQYHFAQKLEDHVIRHLYEKVNEFDAYQTYLSNKITMLKDDFAIVMKIITKVILKDEVFQQNVEDNFINYFDDYNFVKQQLQQLGKKTIKAELSDNYVYIKDSHFLELQEFAMNLFRKTNDHSDNLKEQIDEYSKNWDANRLALIDTILLKMALCELLYFEEIPVKVTMNEYIDISKDYSTPKSKEFINGVLDKMMKDYTKSGKIVKVGRGLN